MMNGGQRIATATGAMLADPAILGNPSAIEPACLFEPRYWQARGECTAVTTGRGAAWFIGTESCNWVLRHYRRGGLIAALAEDKYLWLSESRVRAFAEWRLLNLLAGRGLPVPRPVAARYQRSGISYRCDLITERIAGATPLSRALETAPVEEGTWRGLGAVVRRFHDAGVDHADLNAHNLLLDDQGSAWIIDFDRGRLRPPGGWRSANIRRLHRSLTKISAALRPERFTRAAWNWFLAGYR